MDIIFDISLAAHIIGFVGMMFVCYAFYLSVSGTAKHTDSKYLWTNLVGAILLIISLCVHFNFGSFMIEVFWVIISVTGLWKQHDSKS